MKTRAAVAWEAGKPLEIEEIDLDGPKGGEVFHAGAIPSGWTLSVDARMRTLLRNVLHHFGVKPAVYNL